MTRVWRHMRALWPRWTLVPGGIFWGWSAYWLARGEARWDHLATAVVIPALAYGSARSKRVFVALLPIALVGLLYDAMRFVRNVGVDVASVHTCDLRDKELAWFGVDVDGARITLQDLATQSSTPQLDLLCAVPYGTFIFIVLGYATWLFHRAPATQQRFVWAFLALNVAGFVSYHLYPAAPPWYLRAHGCVADLSAHAEPGAHLARVDALLGVHYFAGMYGRSSDVFGAVPSLHVAYPLLMVFEGFALHGWLGRSGLVAFFLSMCFAAVYLDHHWVIDVLAGITYTVVVAVAFELVDRRTSIFSQAAVDLMGPRE